MLDINPTGRDNKIEPEDPNVLIDSSDITGITEPHPEQYIKVFSFIILGLFLLMSGYIFLLDSNKSNYLENKQANYNNLDQQLKTKELAELNETSVRIDRGLGKISSILKTRALWSILFKELQVISPQDVVYESFNIAEKTDKVKIGGQINSYNSLAILLAALKDSSKFSDVKLNSAIKVQLVDRGEKISFDIECMIKGNNLRSSSKEAE